MQNGARPDVIQAVVVAPSQVARRQLSQRKSSKNSTKIFGGKKIPTPG